MRDLRSSEKHGRSIWAGRGACAASDASSRFHCQIGIMFGNQGRVRLRRGAGACRNKSAGLHNVIERLAIDYQILHKRKRSYAKRLDCDRRTVAKLSHIKLAHRAGMIRSVRFAVDRERTSAANAFTAIGVERDWFLSASDQSLIENVEHFEKRCVRRNVAHFVIDEFACHLSIFLAPYPSAAAHRWSLRASSAG